MAPRRVSKKGPETAEQPALVAKPAEPPRVVEKPAEPPMAVASVKQDVEKPAEPPMPVAMVKQEPTDAIVAYNSAADNSRRNAQKGQGMNPLEVSRMLTMLKKRMKKDNACVCVCEHINIMYSYPHIIHICTQITW